MHELSGPEVAAELGLSLEAVKSRLHRARAQVRERLLASGFEPLGGPPQKFADYLRAETRKWTKVVRDANIRIE